VWSEEEQAQFWHIMGCMPRAAIQKWISEIIIPAIQAKKEQEKKAKKKQGWYSYLTGAKQEEEDDLDQFFDVGQFELQLSANERVISLEVTFEVKELTLLLAKQQTNKIEGIQMYNRGAMVEFKAPNTNLEQFTCEITF
jgi:hypothetical protein